MKIWTYITALIAFLSTYGAGETSPDEGNSFLGEDGDDDDDDGDDSDDDNDTDDDDDGDDSDDDGDTDDDDDDDDDDSDDDDDDDDNSESDSDSEDDGEGADTGGAQALARALREATRARLTAASATREQVAGISVVIPTAAELMELPEFKDIHEDDMTTISKIATAIVEKAITSYNDSAITPMRTQANETARTNKIVRSLKEFNAKYPKALDTHQDAMSEIWDAFVEEFSRDQADEISFEDLYIMAGGKGKAAAKRVKGAAAKLAKDQKRQASRSTKQVGRVGKIRSGGKRKPKGDADAAAAVKHIRQTKFTPFTMG